MEPIVSIHLVDTSSQVEPNLGTIRSRAEGKLHCRPGEEGAPQARPDRSRNQARMERRD